MLLPNVNGAYRATGIISADAFGPAATEPPQSPLSQPHLGPLYPAAPRRTGPAYYTDPLIEEHEVEIQKQQFEERIIEVPEIVYHEKIVEVPQIIWQEKIVHVPRTEYQERITEVPRIEYRDRIIEVPEIHYEDKVIEVPQVVYQEQVRHVPRLEIHERITEIPKVETQERVIDVPRRQIQEVRVPRYIEVPQIQYQHVDRIVEINNVEYRHIPVERVVDVFEGVEEKVIDKHIEVDVPEYREIPRYVEVPQVIYRFVPVEKIVEVPIDVPVEGPPQQLTFDLLHHRTRLVDQKGMPIQQVPIPHPQSGRSVIPPSTYMPGKPSIVPLPLYQPPISQSRMPSMPVQPNMSFLHPSPHPFAHPSTSFSMAPTQGGKERRPSRGCVAEDNKPSQPLLSKSRTPPDGVLSSVASGPSIGVGGGADGTLNRNVAPNLPSVTASLSSKHNHEPQPQVHQRNLPMQYPYMPALFPPTSQNLFTVPTFSRQVEPSVVKYPAVYHQGNFVPYPQHAGTIPPSVFSTATPLLGQSTVSPQQMLNIPDEHHKLISHPSLFAATRQRQ